MTCKVLFFGFFELFLQCFYYSFVFAFELQFLLYFLNDLIGLASRNAATNDLLQILHGFVLGWLIELEFMIIFNFFEFFGILPLNPLHFLFLLA